MHSTCVDRRDPPAVVSVAQARRWFGFVHANNSSTTTTDGW
jgi:hypothetical protein